MNIRSHFGLSHFGPRPRRRLRRPLGHITNLIHRGRGERPARPSAAARKKRVYWPNADFGRTGTDSGCVGMRPDTFGCVWILNSSKFWRILAKFRQKLSPRWGIRWEIFLRNFYVDIFHFLPIFLYLICFSTCFSSDFVHKNWAKSSKIWQKNWKNGKK